MLGCKLIGDIVGYLIVNETINTEYLHKDSGTIIQVHTITDACYVPIKLSLLQILSNIIVIFETAT